MSEQQESSFDVPLYELPAGLFAALFESESPELFLEQKFLEQDSMENTSRPRFQYGSSTTNSSHIPLSTASSEFDAQDISPTLISSYSHPSTLPTSTSLYHPAAEGEGQLFDPWYPPASHMQGQLLDQHSFQTGAHPSLPVCTESVWRPLPQHLPGPWPDTRVPVFRGDYRSSFMEGPIDASEDKLGIMKDPTPPLYGASVPIYEFEMPVEIPTEQASTSHDMGVASVTVNEEGRGTYDNWPPMQLPLLPTSELSNHEGINYPAFSNTFGEGLGYNTMKSTNKWHTVEDQCSGDPPVEQGRNEPNTHGSDPYGLDNALEGLPNAEAWTNESLHLPIAPEQPAPSMSLVEGHVPNCMGGLSVSVTRERKRWRRDKGIRPREIFYTRDIDGPDAWEFHARRPQCLEFAIIGVFEGKI
ncbi:hypothetical protein JR316_0002917 [Psilocybe cubensis]|uniref:Uncharacterized protein n=2 Tax=Psilocybe cubensis TaxID=181762 RepID=A0ACB8H6V7_PSICU|nr:hypothetical protein JR316_0002917 [Psilocybe cubensis]KAH9483449.1 hypothetical protein JR316_0002917 [Psilocybe cubensis]